MQHPIERSLVRILTNDGCSVGGGVLLKDSLICTCAHVVAEALHIIGPIGQKPTENVFIDFPFLSGARVSTKIVCWVDQIEKGQDIAVLRAISPLPPGTTPTLLLPVEDSIGAAFEAYGFPAGYPKGVWAFGKIGNANSSGWLHIFGTRAQGFAVKPGYSGTPVWDIVRQAVVGMVVATDIDERTRVAFAIPSDNVALICPAVTLAEIEEDMPPFDAARGRTFIQAARRSGTTEEILTYLREFLASNRDPTERYWIYITVAEIGGAFAEKILRGGLQERDRFAKLGAVEGCKIIGVQDT